MLPLTKLHELRPKNVYYGWWIVLGGFLTQTLTSSLLQRSFGAYAVLLRNEFGWSKAAISGAFSLQQIESGLLGPVQGWLIDRIGPRLSMRIGVVMFGVGFMLFSQVHELWHYYIIYVVMAIGTSLNGNFPLSVVIVNWFDRRRARALSTMQLGSAVGGMMIGLIALSLETVGWRTTAFASGVIVIALGLPLTMIVRRKPEDYGLEVDGGPPPAGSAAEAKRAKSNNPPGRDFTLREAVRTPAFWLISFGHGSSVMVVSAMNVHLILHLTEDLGFSLALASLAVTTITASQMVGVLLSGTIGDRFDKRKIVFGCMAAQASGLFLIANAPNAGVVFFCTTMHGAVWGLRGPLMQAIRADYFGRSSFGTIFGFSSTIVTSCAITGPLLAGILADSTSSYSTGFMILAVLSGMGAFLFLLTKRPTLPSGGETVEPSQPAITTPGQATAAPG